MGKVLNKTEEAISKNWNHEDPLVSIICVTYNHETYIKDALESFLIQKTTFPFEIIIHDDASTDNTARIIENFAARYPVLIKPIFQKMNQQSQKKIASLIAFSKARGKYIALCDGDDYWTDPYKLQIQVKQMDCYPNVCLSFHPAVAKHVDESKKDRIFAQHSVTNKIFSSQKVILGKSGGGGFCPTASLMLRRQVYENLPHWFREVPVVDYFLQILGSLSGGALYINKVMSVYRRCSINSWSERMAKDEDYAFYYFSKMLQSLENINQFTAYKFKNEIEICKKKVYLFMCRSRALSYDKRKAFFLEHQTVFNRKDKLMWHLLYKHTNFLNFLYKIRNG